MANLNSRRRWRGPALGGRLQRGARFCFSAHDGEATTSRLAEWLRLELVYAGRTTPKPSARCSPPPMITNGSPREPKNAQQVACHNITTADSQNADQAHTAQNADDYERLAQRAKEREQGAGHSVAVRSRDLRAS
jgi:hypothetical protein